MDGVIKSKENHFIIDNVIHSDRSIQATSAIMDINGFKGTSFDIICDSISFNKFVLDFNDFIKEKTQSSFKFMGIKFIHNKSLTKESNNGWWLTVKKNTEQKLISFYLN